MSYELYNLQAPSVGYYLLHKETDLELRFETLEEAEERARVYYDQIPGITQSISVGTIEERKPVYSDKQLRELHAMA